MSLRFVQNDDVVLVLFRYDLAWRDDFIQWYSPVLIVVLISYDIKDLVNSENATERQRHVVSDWQLPMSNALFISTVQGYFFVSVPVYESADYVYISRIKISDRIRAICRQVH